tara:strand:- start:169 stop:381 length:213 start_codon:yes stop_codon:yes gene_type:complete
MCHRRANFSIPYFKIERGLMHILKINLDFTGGFNFKARRGFFEYLTDKPPPKLWLSQRALNLPSMNQHKR